MVADENGIRERGGDRPLRPNAGASPVHSSQDFPVGKASLLEGIMLIITGADLADQDLSPSVFSRVLTGLDRFGCTRVAMALDLGTLSKCLLSFGIDQIRRGGVHVDVR